MDEINNRSYFRRMGDYLLADARGQGTQLAGGLLLTVSGTRTISDALEEILAAVQKEGISNEAWRLEISDRINQKAEELGALLGRALRDHVRHVGLDLDKPGGESYRDRMKAWGEMYGDC